MLIIHAIRNTDEKSGDLTFKKQEVIIITITILGWKQMRK